jgi:tetratricopeptide (TPR) repeat protein
MSETTLLSAKFIKPVIFISYSHADEPDRPVEGEVQWLSFVRRYLQPAVKDGIFELWVDRHMMGGADWDTEIEARLRTSDIFVLLVSANSMSSDYIIDKEIAIIRERQLKGEDVCFYPLLLTPTPKAGFNKVKDKNLRPRGARPFSSLSYSDRLQHMMEAADEIAKIAREIAERKNNNLTRTIFLQPAFVYTSGLPETGYDRLVGREAELKRLDEAWTNRNANVIVLVADGGAGKSALVTEWLKGLQAVGYRGAQSVLGWSFYSQGSKERDTGADAFLSWALEKLDISISMTNSNARGEAIAEAIAKRRVLLVLDGVEPLQYGPGPRVGELKDSGLRVLLRHLATGSSAEEKGLVVLTSRLAIKDIANWKDTTAPIIHIEQLSDEAGAALLRDNGVWGTDLQLKAASRDFDGHPLALSLLASFVKETQFGDIRRRDHIRGLIRDRSNPRHDQAVRVMESLEKEWLAGQPALLEIMHIIGLFDRPASGDCLRALRDNPKIEGLTDTVGDLGDGEWMRAVTRLREVRLLAPPDPSAPDVIDAHPLVRDWFGAQLEKTYQKAWQDAHRRLYEHLRNSTQEGERPTIEDLLPLYQAIAHGCQAGCHQETLEKIYRDRLCRWREDGKIEYYTSQMLGALGTNLAAISWFFETTPYEIPVSNLHTRDRAWIVGQAALALRAQGRFKEALPTERASLLIHEISKDWQNSYVSSLNLRDMELLTGSVDDAIRSAEKAVLYAFRGENKHQEGAARAGLGDAYHAACRLDEAQQQFVVGEQRQSESQPEYPLLYAGPGYYYCDFLIARGDFTASHNRCVQTLEWHKRYGYLLYCALDVLTLARSHLGVALERCHSEELQAATQTVVRNAHRLFDNAVDGLRASGRNDVIPRGLLARSAFHRAIGDWQAAARDLDEVGEIAEPGPMRLFLCDLALELARLAFARIEAFAPLNGLSGDSPPRPIVPSADKIASLWGAATWNLNEARRLIETCGYHRRHSEIVELESVVTHACCFADISSAV